LFDVNETVCLLLIIQIRRDVEGARLEYHFAEFWGAMQMAGSFSGSAVSIILMLMFLKCIYITNFLMLSARHLFVSWFSIFCVLIIIQSFTGAAPLMVKYILFFPFFIFLDLILPWCDFNTKSSPWNTGPRLEENCLLL